MNMVELRFLTAGRALLYPVITETLFQELLFPSLYELEDELLRLAAARKSRRAHRMA
jgi:hypothetical protein